MSIFSPSIDQHFYGVTLVRYAHSDSKRERERERDMAGPEQSVSHVHTYAYVPWEGNAQDGGGSERERAPCTRTVTIRENGN